MGLTCGICGQTDGEFLTVEEGTDIVDVIHKECYHDLSGRLESVQDTIGKCHDAEGVVSMIHSVRPELESLAEKFHMLRDGIRNF